MPVKPEPPILPAVSKLDLKTVEWLVVTPQNIDSVFVRLRDEGREPLLYAVSAEGYISLISNQADVMTMVREQQQVIAVYKKWSYWDHY